MYLKFSLIYRIDLIKQNTFWFKIEHWSASHWTLSKLENILSFVDIEKVHFHVSVYQRR